MTGFDTKHARLWPQAMHRLGVVPRSKLEQAEQKIAELEDRNRWRWPAERARADAAEERARHAERQRVDYWDVVTGAEARVKAAEERVAGLQAQLAAIEALCLDPLQANRMITRREILRLAGRGVRDRVKGREAAA